jgi:hypothetical protein
LITGYSGEYFDLRGTKQQDAGEGHIIRMDLGETERVEMQGIHVAQDREKGLVLMNTIMNVQVE